MEQYYDCNRCPNIISPESEHMTGATNIMHQCGITKERLYHRGKEPMIPPPKTCKWGCNYEMGEK